MESEHLEAKPAEVLQKQMTKNSASRAAKQQKAISLINQGKLQEAEAIYRDLIANGTRNHIIYGNLAAVCGMQGRLDESIELLKKALEIKPDYADAHNNLAKSLTMKGDLNAAINSYKTAISLNPYYPEAYNNIGISLEKEGNLNEAISYYEKALRLKPNLPEAHYNLGNALKKAGDQAAAIDSFRTAIRFKADYPEAHNNIGNILKEQDNLIEAINSYNTAIQLNPKYPDALYNLGIALHSQGELTAAITYFNLAIQLNPNYPDAYNNLGNACKDKGDLKAAIECFNKAIELKPDNPSAHLNSSLAKLLCGDYKNGWDEYEWRLKQGERPSKLYALPNCSEWHGEPLDRGTKLLLVTEQGLGDILHFMRYVLVLQEKHIHVSLCAPQRLHPLILASGIDTSPLTPEEANKIKIGKWVPLLSVPKHLKVSRDNPIITKPYISSTNELNNKWEGIFASGGRPVIGINWRGNREDVSKQGRDIPIHFIKKILAACGGHFLCLQRGANRQEIEHIMTGWDANLRQSEILQIADSDKPEDFLEYAAIVASCDLVISTGSTVAHLAAGIGIPTWVLLPKVPDWRWGLEGDTSFWYPTMRVFRQIERGNWNEVIERVAEALQEKFRNNSPFNEASTPTEHISYLEKPKPFEREFIPVNASLNHEQQDARSGNKTSTKEQLATELINQGKLPAAEIVLRELIDAGTLNHIVYSKLAIIYLHQQKYKESIPLFNQSIEINPTLADTHNSLGIALQQMGALSDAIVSYKKAIQIDPNYAYAYNNLGNTLKLQGELTSAITSYKKAIQINPEFADAYYNLGIILKEQGNLNAAIITYKKALQVRPNDPEIYNSLGSAQRENGEQTNAIVSYKKALYLDPYYSEVYYNIGITLKDQGDLSAAIASCKRALQLKSNYPEAHNCIGNSLYDQGELIAAIASYKKALELKPNYADCYNNLGNALKEQGDLRAAVNSYNIALKLKPSCSEAYNNLGNALKEQNDLTAAIISFKKALTFDPQNPDIHNNIGNAFKDNGDIEEAISSYKKSLALRSYNPEARFNLSIVMLLCGDYKHGLEGYEWRSKQKRNPSKPHALPNCSPWNGEQLKQEAKILVVTEQGLGDTLMFMRYVLALKEQNCDVSLCAPTKLHPLIQASNIDLSPLSPERANYYKHGHWIPLLSVPRHLHVCPSNPIITAPYIKSTSELNAKWEGILSKEQRPVIGINWQGNRNDLCKKDRDIPIHFFKRILEAYKGDFVCLQRGVQLQDFEKLMNGVQTTAQQQEITNIANSDIPQDFLEFAAIITNCELIITTGSTVAHLAAGLGIPTWVMLPKIPDWRWGLEGDTTFWYPSVRLFRQRESGNWNDVIDRIVEALPVHFEYISTHSDAP